MADEINTVPVIPPKKEKRSPVLFAVVGLFLILVVWAVINLSAGRTAFFGRASTKGVFNPANSYVFASPLTARVGGDKIRITVFVLDGQGRGIPGSSVLVGCVDEVACQNASLAFEPVQSGSDNLGQAIYDVSSPVRGKYELQARIGGTSIPQTVTVSFQ